MHHLRHLPVEHHHQPIGPPARNRTTGTRGASSPRRKSKERDKKEREGDTGEKEKPPLHGHPIIRWSLGRPKNLPIDSLDLPWLAHTRARAHDDDNDEQPAEPARLAGTRLSNLCTPRRGSPFSSHGVVQRPIYVPSHVDWEPCRCPPLFIKESITTGRWLGENLGFEPPLPPPIKARSLDRCGMMGFHTCSWLWRARTRSLA